MVLSRVVDSKVLRFPLSLSMFSEKGKNGDCDVTNFRRFLFGMSPDVLTFKFHAFTGNFKF